MSPFLTFSLLYGCFGLATEVPVPVDSGDGGETGAVDTDEPDEDTGCVQMGVKTTMVEWELPPDFPEGTFETAYDSSPTSDPAWGLADLDGNGRTDILVTRNDVVGDPNLGTTSWLYLSNTGSKFRSEADSWSLPGGYPEGTFATPYDINLASPAWVLADLDGDGHNDLVITEDRASSVTGLGTSLWVTYENEGDGFSNSLKTWSLPPGFSEGALSSMADNNPASPTWALVDLNADGRSDFVVTHDDSTEGLGTTSWRVYLNTGTGFSSSASEWLLPEGFPERTFDRVYDDDSLAAPSWGLYDIDGNGRTDLVVTRNDDGEVEGVGTKTWVYYSNTGSRFRTEDQKWALPPSYPTNTFETLSDTNSATPTWALADLDRDQLPDLVVTRDDDADIDELGSSRWQLYSGGEEGFSEENTAWPLPKEFEALSFQAIYDDQTGSPAWSLIDLEGDDLLDIIVTEDGSDTTGTTTWRLYPGKCR